MMINMGRRGAAPKPTALRLLDGDRADRINEHEPMPIDELPECPDTATAEQRAIWQYTLDHLDHMKIARACDRDALFCYVVAVINHRKATDVINRSAILVKGALGNLVRNPALIVQRDNAVLIKHFAQEFGLTPSARSGVEAFDTEASDGDNPFAGTG